MYPGSPPPVLAVPFVPPSWAAIMTSGYRHHRIRRKLRAYHPPSRKETRRANRTSRRKNPCSCAGFVPQVVETSDVRGATLPPVTPKPTISPHGPDRPLSGSLHSVLRFIPTRKETRRANHCKTPRSCAGGDPGPGRRPRSAGAPRATPSRSSDTPSRPYRHNGGYRHREGDDDGKGRPPPPPPPPNPPRGNLPSLKIRCHFLDHAGQCESHCRPDHNGHFPFRIVRKHTTLTFCSDVCMGAFLVDEQDTLISQPWPPHYRAAAGEILNRRVLELLRDPCPDNSMKGHTWPLKSILKRTVYVTEGMNLQDRSQCAVLSRFLYDAIDHIIDSQVHKYDLISVSLLRWATRYAHQHLFRLVGIFTDSKAHCDRWGLELPGMAPSKRTYVPEARSGGKRRQEVPNSSFGRSPHFSSASSSSSDPPPPREPIADFRNKGQSRGEASSSNSVHPPPASDSTPPISSGSIPPILNQIPTFPPGVDPSPEASAILRSKVFELLKRPSAKHKHSYEYWRSITAIIGHRTLYGFY